eukprot:9706529-Lingulodinium_polyedra.AAC.1
MPWRAAHCSRRTVARAVRLPTRTLAVSRSARLGGAPELLGRPHGGPAGPRRTSAGTWPRGAGGAAPDAGDHPAGHPALEEPE